MILLWLANLVLTVYLAYRKKLNFVGYFFFALFFGPIALIFVILSDQNQASDTQSQSDRRLIQSLRTEVALLKTKIKRIETLLDLPVEDEVKESSSARPSVSTPSSTPLSSSNPTRQSQSQSQSQSQHERHQSRVKVANESSSHGIEQRLAKYWLSYVGVIVLVLGVGSLLSYAFMYSAPVLRVVIAYAFAAGLFAFGARYEKNEALKVLGYVLLGGGWALTYFTTYGIHHFEAVRMIDNQALDVFLLSGVVVGMLVHALKYRQESLVASILLIAGFTATIGTMDEFTLLSLVLLSAGLMYLVYRFQWVHLLVLGCIMLYGLHYVYVAPFSSSFFTYRWGMPPVILEVMFLLLYWFVYFVGTHLNQIKASQKNVHVCLAVNYLNFFLLGFFALPLLQQYYPDAIAPLGFVFGVTYLLTALILSRRQQGVFWTSDLVIGVGALTLTVPHYFTDMPSLLIWAVEIPFLFYVGIKTRLKPYIYMSMATAVFAIFYAFGPSSIMLFGHHMATVAYVDLFLMGLVVFALNTLIAQQSKRESYYDQAVSFYDYVSYWLSALCLFWLTIDMVEGIDLASVFVVEALLVYVLLVLLKWKRFIVGVFGLLIAAVGAFYFYNIGVMNITDWWQYVLIVVAVGFIYYTSRVTLKRQALISEQAGVFVLGVMLTFASWTLIKLVEPQWLSLAFGLLAVLLIALGIVWKNRVSRYAGLIFLLGTLMRIIIIDMAQLETIFKIISFIILGILFLMVSFSYNKFSFLIDKEE